MYHYIIISLVSLSLVSLSHYITVSLYHLCRGVHIHKRWSLSTREEYQSISLIQSWSAIDISLSFSLHPHHLFLLARYVSLSLSLSLSVKALYERGNFGQCEGGYIWLQKPTSSLIFLILFCYELLQNSFGNNFKLLKYAYL